MHQPSVGIYSSQYVALTEVPQGFSLFAHMGQRSEGNDCMRGRVCFSSSSHSQSLPRSSYLSALCRECRGGACFRPCTNTVCFALGFIFVLFPPGNLLASSRNEQRRKGSVTALTLDRPTQWPCDHAGGVCQGEATIAVWHLLLHWVLFGCAARPSCHVWGPEFWGLLCEVVSHVLFA